MDCKLALECKMFDCQDKDKSSHVWVDLHRACCHKHLLLILLVSIHAENLHPKSLAEITIAEFVKVCWRVIASNTSCLVDEAINLSYSDASEDADVDTDEERGLEFDECSLCSNGHEIVCTNRSGAESNQSHYQFREKRGEVGSEYCVALHLLTADVDVFESISRLASRLGKGMSHVTYSDLDAEFATVVGVE